MIQLSNFPHPPKAGKLLGALAVKDWGEVNHEDENEEGGWFRRPRFHPNFETNIIFIISCLTGAVTSFVNHGGRPFYRGVLESEKFCKLTIMNILFCLALILESVPLLNRILELRQLPSIASKLAILAIALFDVGACMICQYLSDLYFQQTRNTSPGKKKTSRKSAADMEEELLHQESRRNLRSVALALAFGAYLILDSIATHR